MRVLILVLVLAVFPLAASADETGRTGGALAGRFHSRSVDRDITLLGWAPHADAGDADILAALRESGSAVLVRYGPSGPDVQARVLTSDGGEWITVPLGDVEVLVSRFRLHTRNRNPESLARVREMLWDPLASYLEGRDTIYLILDGGMRSIPPQALATPEQRGHIRLLTTERDLLDPSPAPLEGLPRLVAVGDLLYDSLLHEGTPFPQHLCPAARDLRFRTRSAAAGEMEALRVAWGAYVPDGERRLLTGTIATETAVREALEGARYVHVSSRGYALDDLCPEGRFPDGTIAGVALTGANGATGAESAAADGLLSAGEIARLPLAGVECAVVADLTPQSEDNRIPEGWSVLARAFRLAGARAVLLRNPESSDADAGAWLQVFYRIMLSDRKPAVEAAIETSRLRAEELGEDGGESVLRWQPFLVVGR